MKALFTLSLLFSLSTAVPTASMCRSFAAFASKWNPLPETLVEWTKGNCDKIRPRPADMSCDDVVQFVSDCRFGAGTESNSRLSSRYYEQTFAANYPRVLPKYVHYNRATVYDYGQFGNWYYPNFYPWSYINYFDGRPDSIRRLENDYSFARGGHYPYHRADNIVNIGLQQTSLPTCLHDIFYCVRASSPTPYQQYYQKKALEEEKARLREERRRT